MKKEITLKRCPICGSMPNRRVEDMSGSNYQHYYGCTDYIYECPKCKVLSASRCTVYIDSNEKAEREAQKAWNAECDKYEKLLSWREEDGRRQGILEMLKLIPISQQAIDCVDAGIDVTLECKISAKELLNIVRR